MLLAKLGIKLEPGQVMLIYGPPMVGKSSLACIIARYWVKSIYQLRMKDMGIEVKEEPNILLIGTELAYQEPSYREFIEGFLRGTKYSIEYFDDPVNLFKAMVGTRGGLASKLGAGTVIILDSVSALADAHASELIAKMETTEPRTIAARVSPLTMFLGYRLRRYAVVTKGIGIVIAHAGSMAGTGKYRGLIDFKPSLAQRCGHHITYELYMEIYEPKRDYRVIKVVAARQNPEIEGNSALIRFTPDKDIEVKVG